MSQSAPIFSARVWPQAQTLLLGALLAPGNRTVSAVLEVMGLGAQPQFQTKFCILEEASGQVVIMMLGGDRHADRIGQVLDVVWDEVDQMAILGMILALFDRIQFGCICG